MYFNPFGILPDAIAGLILATNHRDPSPYSIVESIECSITRSDGRQFGAMPLAGDAKVICDVRTRRMCDTAVGAWIN